MEQIHEEYDGQWVFMINIEQDESGSVVGGEVALHSESRESVVRRMKNCDRGKGKYYLRYAGRVPEDVAVLL